MDDINLLTWYSERELTTVPPHFRRASTELTLNSLHWVKSKLSGRYSINSIPVDMGKHRYSILDLNSYIFFEDERDLVIYELKWAGSK